MSEFEQKNVGGKRWFFNGFELKNPVLVYEEYSDYREFYLFDINREFESSLCHKRLEQHEIDLIRKSYPEILIVSLEEKNQMLGIL